MKAISQDLRERILDTVERGDGSLRQIAGRFLVSVSFIMRLLQLYRSTGSLEPRPHGGGNPAVLGPEELSSSGSSCDSSLTPGLTSYASGSASRAAS